MNTRHLSHASDPAVSRDAADSLNPTTTHTVMLIIVDLIDRYGELTPKELEQFYARLADTNNWPTVAPFTVSKRASELKKKVGVLTGTKIRRDGAEALALAPGFDVVTGWARINEHMRKK